MSKAALGERVNRRYRACLQCGLVRPESVFYTEGCANCPELQLDYNREVINSKTTRQVKAVALVFNSEASVVAKLLRLPATKGMYAPQR